MMWVTLIFAATAGGFLALTLAALLQLRWAQRLPALGSLSASCHAPDPSPARVRCSVVIAARDEAARIENTIKHLLAQQGVQVEVLVVDDRSTDGTGEILKRLMAADPRVQSRRVDILPDHWLGKSHACHLGASAATGDWILFTDADCWLKPDVITRALRVAEQEAADHITLTPGTALMNLGARAWYLTFLTSLLGWIAGVNRDRPKAFLGIGAFNLVRTSAYRECGGYEALRLTVLDDIKLGLLLRRAGKRTRGFLGGDDVECHWGTTVRGMVKILEKNYFAVTDYRLWLVAAGSLFALLVIGILLAGLASGTALGLSAGLSPMLLTLPAAVLATRLGWTWPCAALMPFMFPVFLYAMLNSTWVTLRQGGVRWRETLYPLDILRRGNVR